MKNNIPNRYYSKTLKVFLSQIPDDKIDDEDLEIEKQEIKNTIKGDLSYGYNNNKTKNTKRTHNQTTKKNKTQNTWWLCNEENTWWLIRVAVSGAITSLRSVQAPVTATWCKSNTCYNEYVQCAHSHEPQTKWLSQLRQFLVM